jgi:putative Holliday junction resolvase
MHDCIKATKVLGFDFGKKQIGIATGQTVTHTSSALTIVKAKNGIPDWISLDKIIMDWEPDIFVVGLPLNMDLTEGPLSHESRKFALSLQNRFGRKAEMMDERLTSREAKEQRQTLDGKHSNKVDDLAAALILQSWLENPSLGQKP